MKRPVNCSSILELYFSDELEDQELSKPVRKRMKKTESYDVNDDNPGKARKKSKPREPKHNFLD